MKIRVINTGQSGRETKAFTLAEVMIATAILFMCMFGILGVLSQGLRSARLLRRDAPTAGMVAAQFFGEASTNRVEEGSDSGDFSDFYKGYRWSRECNLISNGLYQLTIVITHDGKLDSSISTYIYDGKSPGQRR